MPKLKSDSAFWASLCADVQAAGGLLIHEPPRVTERRDPDRFVIEIDVPGFDETELTITWDDGSVRVVGQASLADAVRQGAGTPRDFVLRRVVPAAYDTARLEALLRGTVLVLAIPARADPGAEG